jgi:hypothetical protein
MLPPSLARQEKPDSGVGFASAGLGFMTKGPLPLTRPARAHPFCDVHSSAVFCFSGPDPGWGAAASPGFLLLLWRDPGLGSFSSGRRFTVVFSLISITATRGGLRSICRAGARPRLAMLTWSGCRKTPGNASLQTNTIASIRWSPHSLDSIPLIVLISRSAFRFYASLFPPRCWPRLVRNPWFDGPRALFCSSDTSFNWLNRDPAKPLPPV